jgi:hypothetical protein
VTTEPVRSCWKTHTEDHRLSLRLPLAHTPATNANRARVSIGNMASGSRAAGRWCKKMGSGLSWGGTKTRGGGPEGVLDDQCCHQDQTAGPGKTTGVDDRRCSCSSLMGCVCCYVHSGSLLE